jgi:hypothetical protein
MAQGFVARAMQAGLAKIGEPSLLRGVTCGNATLNRGVELQRGTSQTEDDNYVGVHDIASINAAFDPAVGDNFDHPDGLFKLDRKVSDNGFTRQFIVVAR